MKMEISFILKYKMGSRASFTIEAVISLLILVVILARPVYNVNLDKAVAYKQGSDISEIILDLGLSTSEARIILEATNPDLQMKIIRNGIETKVKWENPKNVFVIRRVDFSGDKPEDVYFYFGY